MSVGGREGGGRREGRERERESKSKLEKDRQRLKNSSESSAKKVLKVDCG